MALKLKLEKLDGLAEAVAALYKKTDAGYVLDVEGIDDGAELKRAKDRERDLRKEAEKRAKELETQLDAMQTERDGLLSGAIPKADVEKLEASWKGKLTKRENELTGQANRYKGALEKATVRGVAAQLAAKVSTVPALLEPVILSRLRLEESGDDFAVRVLAPDGSVSAATVEDLEKELLAKPELQPILIGSKGSGSGASGNGRGGAGSGSGKKVSRQAFDAMSPREKHAFVNEGGDVVDTQ